MKDWYKIDFAHPPPFLGIRKTPLNKGDFQDVLLEEVQILFKKETIELIPPEEELDSFYSTFFIIPKKGGGRRPILNLRQLNAYVVHRTFRMETLRKVIKAVKPGDWLVSVDLQDAYMHIPIHPNFQKFLRFKIGGQTYQYKVLPFGQASAQRMFIKVMAPIVAVVREEGIFVFPYLDNWILRYQLRTILPKMLTRLLEIWDWCGLIRNITKIAHRSNSKFSFLRENTSRHRTI